VNNKKIKNIAFDLGGVVLTLNYEQAVSRFEEIGLKNARQHLDVFQQRGIFGDLESGKIGTEDFRRELSLLVGRTLTADECCYAWQGYADHVPQRNLQKLLDLRCKGFQVCLLSNTNPFMMQWANGDFDSLGHPISHYFDALYLSYQCKVMKPHPAIFQTMLQGQQALPDETLFIDDGPRNVEAAAALGIHTLCPQNGEDWTGTLEEMLAGESDY
jgi:putative hydrolase of the HAD superfamily